VDLPGHDLADRQEFEQSASRRSGEEALERPGPEVDAGSNGEALRDPGDDHGTAVFGHDGGEVVVLGDEDELGFGRQAGDDLGVGDASLPEHDDVVDLVAPGEEMPVELEREILVEEDPQEASLTAGGVWAARWAA
jgi:hypothetical protein